MARSAASVRAAGPLGHRLRCARSLLLIVDVQERVAAAVDNATGVVAQCSLLLRAASLLDVPIILTEHCVQQLGPTLEALRAQVGPEAIEQKTHFSAADEPALAQRMAIFNRPQIVIAGMESHVCVLQTALSLAERGYRPYVVADATGSRREESRAIALDRLRAAQVEVVTAEMVLFEWLEHAARRELRELLELIK